MFDSVWPNQGSEKYTNTISLFFPGHPFQSPLEPTNTWSVFTLNYYLCPSRQPTPTSILSFITLIQMLALILVRNAEFRDLVSSGGGRGRSRVVWHMIASGAEEVPTLWVFLLKCAFFQLTVCTRLCISFFSQPTSTILEICGKCRNWIILHMTWSIKKLEPFLNS